MAKTVFNRSMMTKADDGDGRFEFVHLSISGEQRNSRLKKARLVQQEVNFEEAPQLHSK